MKKGDILNSLTFWLIFSSVLMYLVAVWRDIIWEGTDWIFLFIIVIGIVLNVKLNKLLSNKK
jgi:hypothetical protein